MPTVSCLYLHYSSKNKPSAFTTHRISLADTSSQWLKTDLGGGDMADLAPEEGAKASLDIIFKDGQEYNGKLQKVFVKGWEMQRTLMSTTVLTLLVNE